jgi:hypothetical protein
MKLKKERVDFENEEEWKKGGEQETLRYNKCA